MCVVYSVGINNMVCQSVVEVTFRTEVQTEWDGKEERVDLARGQNGGIWSGETEW